MLHLLTLSNSVSRADPNLSKARELGALQLARAVPAELRDQSCATVIERLQEGDSTGVVIALCQLCTCVCVCLGAVRVKTSLSKSEVLAALASQPSAERLTDELLPAISDGGVYPPDMEQMEKDGVDWKAGTAHLLDVRAWLTLLLLAFLWMCVSDFDGSLV